MSVYKTPSHCARNRPSPTSINSIPHIAMLDEKWFRKQATKAAAQTRTASTSSAMVSTQQSDLHPVPAPVAPPNGLALTAQTTDHAETEGQISAPSPQAANDSTPKPASKARRPRTSSSRAFASSSQSVPEQSDSQTDRENLLALVNGLQAEDIDMLEPEPVKPSAKANGKKRASETKEVDGSDVAEVDGSDEAEAEKRKAKRPRSSTGSTIVDLTVDEDEPEEGEITEPVPKRVSFGPSDLVGWAAEWDADKKKIAAMESWIVELEEKEVKIGEENGLLKESNAKLTTDNQIITKSCNDIIHAHHNLKKANKEQANTIGRLENEKTAAEVAKADMEARRDSLALQNGKLDYELKQLVEKHAVGVKKIEKQDADLQRIRKQRSDLFEHAKKSEAELKETRKELEELRKKMVEDAEAKVIASMAEMEKCQVEVERLKKEAERR